MATIDHQFPQFESTALEFSDPNLFLDRDGDFSPPLGFASDLDLDLDDISVDFSLDDYLVDPDPGPDPDPDPHPPSSESSNSSSSSAAVINHDGEVKVEEQRHKRKNDGEKSNPNPNPSPNSSSNPDPNLRSVKYQRSDEANSPSSFSIGGGDDDDDKRKTRLMRNRESAQLSRQRKKHYVEELEDKVRAMNSTIAELNGKISFYMSENARLHHQLTDNNGGNPPPPPPPSAASVYPAPFPTHFPWVPYPGYPMYRPGAAHVPLIPIPRLKSQQPAVAPARKAKIKKSGEGRSKTKKVASVSLLGLFFVFLVFRGVLNFGFGGSGDTVSGRVLNVSGRSKGMNHTESKHNSSESIPALLYVPRNGKHVEINGNLIIHSVLASERAMAEAKAEEKTERSLGKEATGLAIPALAVPISERDMRRHPKAYRDATEHHRALPSESEKLKSSVVDAPLQQWFREGLAGPILSSGTCTEVFQFEVSPASTIIPATTVVNTTDELPLGKMKNRRILYPQLAGSTLNDTFGKTSEHNRTFHGNSTVPSMVVSIMADPREAGDGDVVDGMMGPKSLSRIFVVVLMDSVKYVTYSCMLPLKSHGPHLVN